MGDGREGRQGDRQAMHFSLPPSTAHLCCGSKAAECLGDLSLVREPSYRLVESSGCRKFFFLDSEFCKSGKSQNVSDGLQKKGHHESSPRPLFPFPFFFNLTFHVSLHIAMQLGPQAKMWKILAYLGLYFFLLILITLRLEATGLWINLLEVQKPQKAEACFSTKASVWVKVL